METKKPYFVHPSSIIDEGAKIGNGSKIWHFCHVMAIAELGDNCILGQNVFVGKNVKIGQGVKIQNNVSVYDGVELEDGVFVGPSVVFTNVMNPRSFIERKDAFKKTLVKKGATIGANSTIVCGTEIGAYAFIAAGAVVTANVPDFALIKGIPGKITGWMSRNGLKLAFDNGAASCPETGEVYKKEGNRVYLME